MRLVFCQRLINLVFICLTGVNDKFAYVFLLINITKRGE